MDSAAGGLVRTVTVNEWPGSQAALALGEGGNSSVSMLTCEKDKKNLNFFKVGEKHPSTLTPLYQVN